MARLSNKILRDGFGSIGGMIVYTVEGNTYVRSKPSQYNDRKSATQLAQRQRMVLVMDFLKPFKKLVKFTFPGESGKRSGYFAAKSWNLKHGLKGTYPGILMDRQKALLCHGPVALPGLLVVSRLGQELVIGWDGGGADIQGDPNDTLVVMAQVVRSHQADFQFTGVKRSKGRYRWQPELPDDGKKWHVWVAFRRADQVTMSDSRYVGER